MFTGLIEAVGVVETIDAAPDSAGSRLTIRADATFLEHARIGDSIAVDGACMTVVTLTPERFNFEASPETLDKTVMGRYQAGTRVNLERPLTPASPIGGHYVTGHVDGLARMLSCEQDGNSWVYRFEVDSRELALGLVPKGSVTLSGISLTVNTVSGKTFSVAIIPHTLSHTNLADRVPGDTLNIETDLLGKYVYRFMQRDTQPEQAPAPRTASIRSGSWFNHDGFEATHAAAVSDAPPVVFSSPSAPID